jgi:ADP-dependent NAD(P)H-hydrate dehydratase / NAD(P)H-hydrate epimerase
VRPVFTSAEMRDLDRRAIAELGIAGATLMENAGRGAAAALVELLPTLGAPRRGARVVIVCGKGGNGGDGFVAARWLARRGLRVEVLLAARPTEITGDSAGKLAALRRAGIAPVVIADAAQAAPRLAAAYVVVDALLGTGARGAPTGLVADLVERVNASGRPVVALDVPSGLPADGGPPVGPAVRAAVTLTFAGLKLGLVQPPGLDFAGRVRVIPIGVPDAEAARGVRTWLVERADVAAHFPPRPRDAHKGTYGYLLIVGGSRGKTGAAVLAARAAMRAGGGLVVTATAASQQPVVAGLVVESMTEPLAETAAGTVALGARERVLELARARDAVALGPGLGLEAETQELARGLAGALDRPLVLDADALTALAGRLELLRAAPAPRCLTPHPAEMARLLGTSVADVQRDRVAAARGLATGYGVNVALKGSATVVAAADGRVFLNPTGNPGMASGGTGDVLTGIVGAFLARGLAPADALVAAVYLHGAAGDLAAARVGEESLIASDVIDALPQAFAALRA